MNVGRFLKEFYIRRWRRNRLGASKRSSKRKLAKQRERKACLHIDENNSLVSQQLMIQRGSFSRRVTPKQVRGSAGSCASGRIGLGEECGCFVCGHMQEGRVQTVQGGELWGKGHPWKFSYWYVSFPIDVDIRYKLNSHTTYMPCGLSKQSNVFESQFAHL